MSEVKLGKVYGFIVLRDGENIFESMLEEFYEETSVFEGFLDGINMMMPSFTDKGYGYFDFGLLHICAGQSKINEKMNYVVLTNSDATKKEGYQMLTIMIAEFEELHEKQIENGGIKPQTIDPTFDTVKLVNTFNEKLRELYTVRKEIMAFFDKKQWNSDILSFDDLNITIDFKPTELMNLPDNERAEKLDEFFRKLVD